MSMGKHQSMPLDPRPDGSMGPTVPGSAATSRSLAPFWRAAHEVRDWLKTAPPALDATPTSGKSKKPTKKDRGASVTSTSETYAVTTDSGTVRGLARSTAALGLVRGLVEVGVAPEAIRKVLGPKRLRDVPGILEGGALWAALKDTGVGGVKSKWFVEAPICLADRTYVLNASVWTGEYAATVFPKLCALDPSGRVEYDVELREDFA